MNKSMKRPRKSHVKQARSSRYELPSSVKGFIAGDILNLSDASVFYKKKAETATLLKDYVEPLPKYRYRLNGEFLDFFLINLPLFLRNDPRGLSDALAEALYFFARQWLLVDYRQPPTVLPVHEWLMGGWSLVDSELKRFAESGGAIGEWWQCVVGEDGSLSLDCDESRQSAIGFTISSERRSPPTVNISIQGQAAVAMIKFWITRKRADPGSSQSDKVSAARVQKILDSALKLLKVQLGICKSSSGRPPQSLNERAAYLHLHEGKSIRAVSLAIRKGSSGASESDHLSRDRTRKAITNYFESLRNNFKSLLVKRNQCN